MESRPADTAIPTGHTEVPSASAQAQSSNVEHECMTAKELASWMRVDRKTVYEYAARNVIPCRRLGRRLLFLRPAVIAWLARSSSVNAPPDRR